MDFLIHLSLFGRDYKKLLKREIILQKQSSAIIHISSSKRMKQLFTLSGKCAVDFSLEGLVYNCGGKVNIKRKGRNVTGFIMEDDGKEYWRVRLTSSNTILQVLKAKFVSDKDGG